MQLHVHLLKRCFEADGFLGPRCDAVHLVDVLPERLGHLVDNFVRNALARYQADPGGNRMDRLFIGLVLALNIGRDDTTRPSGYFHELFHCRFFPVRFLTAQKTNLASQCRLDEV